LYASKKSILNSFKEWNAKLKQEPREEVHAENLKLKERYVGQNSKLIQNVNDGLQKECAKLYKSV
jgi:hypothetical protein